jgi:hypothetical protein
VSLAEHIAESLDHLVDLFESGPLPPGHPLPGRVAYVSLDTDAEWPLCVRITITDGGAAILLVLADQSGIVYRRHVWRLDQTDALNPGYHP